MIVKYVRLEAIDHPFGRDFCERGLVSNLRQW